MRVVKELNRKCLVCGRKLKIIVKDKKGHYKGGHYFGKLELHKRYRSTGRHTKLGKMKVGIAEGIGKLKIVEYWECDKCFKE